MYLLEFLVVSVIGLFCMTTRVCLLAMQGVHRLSKLLSVEVASNDAFVKVVVEIRAILLLGCSSS